MISIYIHWPYCLSKCPYCDFNSHVTNAIDQSAFVSSYLAEMNHYKDYLKNKTIKSIFFGGGTPTLAEPFVIGETINHLSKFTKFSKNTEITLEGNPTSIEYNKFKEFKNAGINRISIGVQSFEDEDLKFLGREHSSKDALKAIEYADSIFNNYSFDLIYALPNQTLDKWRTQLEYAMKFAKYHISLYQLTIEKGTKFYSDFNKKKFTMPSDDLAADFYLLTEEVLNNNNFQAYEVSNYAKAKYECAHNMAYWNYNDYLGIGPGAHSRITIDGKKHAVMNIHDPKNYLQSTSNQGHAKQQFNMLTGKEIWEEKIMMGLRSALGIDANLVHADTLNELVGLELLRIKNSRASATLKGRMTLNSINKLIVKRTLNPPIYKYE
jgi:putative oxygen-independent coproporphyrinogen III oxidase